MVAAVDVDAVVGVSTAGPTSAAVEGVAEEEAVLVHDVTEEGDDDKDDTESEEGHEDNLDLIAIRETAASLLARVLLNELTPMLCQLLYL